MAYSAGGHLMAAMCISLGDYDNDGWLDLYISDFQGSSDHVWHGDGKGNFDEVSDELGITAPTHNVLSFGGGFLDYDNDGFTDILVANNGDPPLLLRNSGNANHFLNLKLIGVKSNRDAIGARVRVTSGGISQIREITGGGSYLSQNDLRANFGLGNARKVEMVEIKWPRPSAAVERFTDLPIDRYITIVEGEGKWT